MDTSSLSSISSGLGIVNASRASAVAIERTDERIEEKKLENKQGGPLYEAMAQTLSQFGVALSAANGAPPATESQAHDVENALAANTQNVAQALPGFMHALFQSLTTGNAAPAVSQSSSGAQVDRENAELAAISASGSKAYGNLEDSLQSLVQSLSTENKRDLGSGDPSQAASTPLESAFQNLAKAVQADSNTGSSKMPDLQSFLQNLQQRMQTAGSRLDSAGNLINTQA